MFLCPQTSSTRPTAVGLTHRAGWSHDADLDSPESRAAARPLAAPSLTASGLLAQPVRLARAKKAGALSDANPSTTAEGSSRGKPCFSMLRHVVLACDVANAFAKESGVSVTVPHPCL